MKLKMHAVSVSMDTGTRAYLPRPVRYDGVDGSAVPARLRPVGRAAVQPFEATQPSLTVTPACEGTREGVPVSPIVKHVKAIGVSLQADAGTHTNQRASHPA